MARKSAVRNIAQYKFNMRDSFKIQYMLPEFNKSLCECLANTIYAGLSFVDGLLRKTVEN